MRTLRLLTLWLSLSALVFAEGPLPTTADIRGTRYTGVRYGPIKDGIILVYHDKGTVQVPLAVCSDAVIKNFGQNPASVRREFAARLAANPALMPPASQTPRADLGALESQVESSYGKPRSIGRAAAPVQKVARYQQRDAGIELSYWNGQVVKKRYLRLDNPKPPPAKKSFTESQVESFLNENPVGGWVSLKKRPLTIFAESGRFWMSRDGRALAQWRGDFEMGTREYYETYAAAKSAAK